MKVEESKRKGAKEKERWGREAQEEIWAEREMEKGGWLILYVHKKTARRSSPAVIYPILESRTVPWLFIDYHLFYYACVCVCSNVMWCCFVNWSLYCMSQ